MNRNRWAPINLDFPLDILAIFISIFYPLNSEKRPNSLLVLKRSACVLVGLLASVSVFLLYTQLHAEMFLGLGLSALIGIFLPFIVLDIGLVIGIECAEDILERRATTLARKMYFDRLSASQRMSLETRLKKILLAIEPDSLIAVKLKAGFVVTAGTGFAKVWYQPE